MKLSGQAAARYLSAPDPKAAGLLLYGADAMRVALRRQDVLKALLGPEAEAEMRLARLTGAELRSDPAKLLDAVKAVGFFPGPRAVLVEDATDGLAAVFEGALAEWQDGDAQIVATAKALAARSKLRKLFEGARTAHALGIYDDPPGRAEIEAALKDAGVGEVTREAMGDIETLARTLDLGDFRQVVEKLALYKLGDPEPVAPADVAAVAPVTREAAIDDILDAVAGAEPSAVAPLVHRIGQQGVGAVSLCLAAERHFRALHAAAIHPEGPAQGLASLRPPVPWTRRDRMGAQARAWGRDKLEYAISLLLETDMSLRSSARAPQMAVMERALIRLASVPRQGRS
ncbi:DNA polymerase III subunit delta [Rhodobacterales bacterium HKCCE2091]|nr:DNA polymerase III subunit delta [Rhodobacterales bacterium HKCCE2091]